MVLGSRSAAFVFVNEKRMNGYSQLVDAAVVKLDLCADEHLTGLLRVEPQLDP